MRTRSAVAASLAALAVLMSGCAVTVAQSDLEAEVGREDGVASVSCDGDLEGEVGATQDCLVTFDDDTTVEITVTVTEVDGSDVIFDFSDAG
ncbi:DUF4333 domain-containing protein [Nocardioides sp.]|uniref:DUF4333 domain-containing protein n=1 Tax=Nocardioides sp. TaxID=35761 RepID=UPI002B26B2F2|nr:DUF4333 domain-containing protein [Nocardioides sp.]